MSFLITTMIYILVFRTADLFLVTPSCPALRLDPLSKSVVEGGVQAIGRGTLVLQEDEVLGLVVIPAGTHWIPKLTIAMENGPCLHDL